LKALRIRKYSMESNVFLFILRKSRLFSNFSNWYSSPLSSCL